MRISIDATSLLLRSAGVKNYTYHWLRSLRRAAAGDSVAAFPMLGDVSSLDHESSALSFWATAPRLAALYTVNALGPAALRAAIGATDVFHASNQVHHAPGKNVRLTATVHDLTALTMPELHTAGNVRADAVFTERILKRADGLIAVSENTRQDAIRVLKIDPRRIVTIYSGIAPEYFAARPTPQAKPYVLYVGAIEPRKNLETLLDAWKALRGELRENFELVIAGPMGWAAESTQARIRAESTYLGYVPEAELPGLIAGATAFAYPSLYEGFGFPVAQAMAAGVAVLTSNISCLPEVAGQGALLVDPRSASELTAALARLLESDSLRDELGRYGRERAQRYRWEACAAESLEFFRAVCGRG